MGNLKSTTVDAKIKHWVSENIDISAATAVTYPSLYDPDRRIVIVAWKYEVNVALAAAGPAAMKLGNSGDDDAYGTMSVATTDAAGAFVAGTLLGPSRNIPPATSIRVKHTQVAQAGDGYFHIWYYELDNSNAHQVGNV